MLPGNPPREPTPRRLWPDWLEWKPNRIWGYDFTHFSRTRRAAIAILDVASRKWLTTLVAAEESSIQVEVASPPPSHSPLESAKAAVRKDVTSSLL